MIDKHEKKPQESEDSKKLKELDTAESMKEKGRDQKTKIGIITVVLFLILILIGGGMFYLSNSSVEEYYFEYNGIEFTPNKDTSIGYKMMFYVNNAQYPVIMTVRNDPRDLEDISIDIEKVRSMIEGKSQIYITQNPRDNLTGATTVAAIEIDYFIDNEYLYNIPVNSSFTETYDDAVFAEVQVIKTCEDSNEETTVVWLRVGNETSVFEENGCLVVQGTDEMEIIAAADRLYLTMVGIMS